MGNPPRALINFTDNACSRTALVTCGPSLGLNEALAKDIGKAFVRYVS